MLQDSWFLGRRARRAAAFLTIFAACFGWLTFADRAKAQAPAIYAHGDTVVTGFSGILPPVPPFPSGDALDETFINLDGPSMQIQRLQPAGPPAGQMIASPTVFTARARDVGVAFGGDVEARGYMWRGLFLGGGIGLSGVPKRSIVAGSEEKGITVGLGGKVDFGYEFWLNSTAALGVALTFDARFVPGSRFPRQTALIGVRFAWY